MRIITTQIPRNHNYHNPPDWWREANAQRATAIDPLEFPIIARHWPLALIDGDKLACNDDSPLVHRLRTSPAKREPGQ